MLVLTHINITMPASGESTARHFYGELLGLREILKPETLRVRGGLWFEAGTCDIHISVAPALASLESQRHIGLACTDLHQLRTRLTVAGVQTDDGRPAPWKRFFVHDPFGNRLEIHEPAGFRG